jgi:hypothetical protein
MEFADTYRWQHGLTFQQVQCSYCSTWQHLHCYGFTGAADPRLPEEHVCYWCLLGDTDVENYKSLQKLAVRRRAIFHVAKSGMRTRTDLSKVMGTWVSASDVSHANFRQVFRRPKAASFTR